MIFRRLKDLRDDNDYKQIQLAKYLQINQSTYSDYEKGNINVPIEAMIKLADFYNTSIDYITERTDEKQAYPACKSRRK